MALFVFLLSISTLGLIAWQDFQSRQIHVLGLLVVFAMGLWNAVYQQNELDVWSLLLLNVSMVGMMVSLTYVLWRFVLRNGRLVDQALGLGDLLLLLAFSLWAAPMHFMIAVLLGCVLGIVVPQRGGTIPLASWLAVSFGIVLILDAIGVIGSRYSLYFP